MSYGYTIFELGDKLSDLVVDQSEWSQRTFGVDSVRGPLGPLKHLEKEAVEAQAVVGCKADFTEEMADCLLLVLDASRRGGVKVMQLIEAAQKKMQRNKARQWPTGGADEPVEHVREQLTKEADRE